MPLGSPLSPTTGSRRPHRRRRRPPSTGSSRAGRWPPGRSPGAELTDLGDPQHGDALGVAAVQVDARRVMPQSWSPAGSSRIWRTVHTRPASGSSAVSLMISIAGPRALAPVWIRECSAKYGSSASCQSFADQPDSASSSPRSHHCRRAASSTRRNSALRTSTRKARRLWVTGGVWSSRAEAISLGCAVSGLRSRSHSSSRLESTWRTSSPSQAIRSATSSVRASSGTVCRSALYASAR